MPVELPIETERLLVRSFRPEADSETMWTVYGDAKVMRFIPGGALADLEAVVSVLNVHATAQRDRGFSSWALVERASSRVIGDVGFGIFRPSGDIELGYTLARDCWGKGYATEPVSRRDSRISTHLGSSPSSMRQTPHRYRSPSG